MIFSKVKACKSATELTRHLLSYSTEMNINGQPSNFLQIAGASSVYTTPRSPRSPRSPASVFSDDQSCGGVELPQEDKEANSTSTGSPTPQGLALWQTGASPSQQNLGPVNGERSVVRHRPGFLSQYAFSRYPLSLAIRDYSRIPGFSAYDGPRGPANNSDT
ncbi:Protein of unknown function [Pyronema omphalodes CBS 100304]|uniref:Uncharacterized protein n=1 Tax=Pyronema omphalodes (strain CBS 100304) TaxID=1076935 RepID=U4KZH0_PYROM|nr:Protein of unknown function [Pyronema omphalodes CBS 100304]